MAEQLSSEIEDVLDLDKLRYSSVWEDAEILSEALAIDANDTVLSITSGGDNVLRLLLDKPKKIVAVDFSPTQTAVLELKIAMIKELSREQAITLMGYGGTPEERIRLYSSLQGLPASTRMQLEKAAVPIGDGLCHGGKLEKFIEKVVTEAMIAVAGQQRVDEYLYAETPAARHAALSQWSIEDVYGKAWEVYSTMMGPGRDLSQFKYVNLNASECGRYFATTNLKWLFREADLCRPNHYLSCFLSGPRGCQKSPGDVIDTSLPAYLRSGNYECLKGLVDRIDARTGSIEGVLSGSFMFQKANLSDIFEYMSGDAAQVLYQGLARHCSVGGRMAFWNLLVDRHPEQTASATAASTKRFRLLGGLSAKLRLQDRIPFYNEFFVCECIAD